MATMSVSLVLLLAALIGQGNACVYLMGQALDSVAPKPAGTSWTYGFKGDDWKGTDATNKPWICQTGKKQSPLNLHGLDTTSKSPSALRTTWEYQPMKSNGSNIQVYNNGHTIQIQWAPGTLTSNVRVQTKGQTATDVLSMSEQDVKSMKTATATPLQFHFHSDSEHTVEGHFAPLEMHIVHSIPQSQLSGCPATGCLMVTGMTFKLSEDGKDNAYLKDIFDAMPTREGVMTDLAPGKTVDLQKLLPSDQTYAQYEGSLTTPPCTEGLLWHVFTEPLPISLKQLKQYATAVGLKECKLKKGAKGGRSLRAGEEDAEAPATSFERGSYSGFTYVSHAHLGRSLLAAAANPDKYVCTIKSVGQTNRWPQPLNDRTVKVF